ncbi:unnamed protein product [Urochloa humidicola]
MQPLADGEEEPWSWMYGDADNNDNDDDGDEDDDNDDGNDSDDDEQSGNAEEESDDEASIQEEEDSSFNSGASDGNNDDDDLESINEENDNDDEEEDEDEEESSDDEASDQEVKYSLNGADGLLDGEEVGTDDTVPYQPKDHTCIRRRLVESCEGRDLLMVRHQTQAPPRSRAYTRKVEVFKADIEGDKWVPVTTDVLAQGEALFLSRSFCKCTRAYGDIEEGLIYFMDIYDVFDTKSWTLRPLTLPPQWGRADTKLLTWFFPRELVL